MSKALQDKIDELFELTKDLRSFEEIKPHCDRFNEWIKTYTNYSGATLGTKLSAYGFYKKFKSIPLQQEENAESIAKHDAEGNIKGNELKHYAVVLCGLNKDQWQERNQSSRVIDRLENSTEIDPDRYLETTGVLLASEKPNELAVGLIAATGRRPHEVIARAKFTAIKDKPYHVMFSGQGKKRGETPVFEIATLYPADYIIKALKRLRADVTIQSLIKKVTEQYSSITRQNIDIDNSRGTPLRRVVKEYFGDKGDKNPVLAFRYGDEQDNNKALRAAYAVLATERDCKGSFGAKIYHACKLLGHYTKEIKDDRDLGKLGTSAGYSDYYVTKPVIFTEVKMEKTTNVKASVSDLEKIKELQNTWNLHTQKDVVARLLKSAEHIQSLEKRLMEFQKEITSLQEENQQLKENLERMNDQQNQQVEENLEVSNQTTVETSSDNRVDKLEAQMNLLMQQMQRLTESISSGSVNESLTISNSNPKQPIKSKPDIDWESISDEQLRSMKTAGALEQKIYRAYRAIADYNDNAPSNNDRWYVGTTTLSQVSGCNRQAIGEWVKTHHHVVDDHNNKYGLGQYHNKRHKGVAITEKVKLWE